MIRESVDFVYDGISSRELGLINVSVESGLYTESLFHTRTIQEVSTNRDKPFFQGVKKEPLQFQLSFGFEEPWNDILISKIKQLFSQEYYKPLTFIDYPDRVFYCMTVDDSKLIHNGLKQGYLTLTFRCDCPYSHSTETIESQEYNVTDTGLDIMLFNDGEVKVKPTVEITKTVDNGGIEITNLDKPDSIFRFDIGKEAKGILNFYETAYNGETLTIDDKKFEYNVSTLSGINFNNYNSNTTFDENTGKLKFIKNPLPLESFVLNNRQYTFAQGTDSKILKITDINASNYFDYYMYNKTVNQIRRAYILNSDYALMLKRDLSHLPNESEIEQNIEPITGQTNGQNIEFFKRKNSFTFLTNSYTNTSNIIYIDDKFNSNKFHIGDMIKVQKLLDSDGKQVTDNICTYGFIQSINKITTTIYKLTLDRSLDFIPAFGQDYPNLYNKMSSRVSENVDLTIPNVIKIEDSINNTLINTKACINKGTGEGTKYGIGTIKHKDVTASIINTVDNTLLLQSITYTNVKEDKENYYYINLIGKKAKGIIDFKPNTSIKDGETITIGTNTYEFDVDGYTKMENIPIGIKSFVSKSRNCLFINENFKPSDQVRISDVVYTYDSGTSEQYIKSTNNPIVSDRYMIKNRTKNTDFFLCRKYNNNYIRIGILNNRNTFTETTILNQTEGDLVDVYESSYELAIKNSEGSLLFNNNKTYFANQPQINDVIFIYTTEGFLVEYAYITDIQTVDGYYYKFSFDRSLTIDINNLSAYNFYHVSLLTQVVAEGFETEKKNYIKLSGTKEKSANNLTMAINGDGVGGENYSVGTISSNEVIATFDGDNVVSQTVKATNHGIENFDLSILKHCKTNEIRIARIVDENEFKIKDIDNNTGTFVDKPFSMLNKNDILEYQSMYAFAQYFAVEGNTITLDNRLVIWGNNIKIGDTVLLHQLLDSKARLSTITNVIYNEDGTIVVTVDKMLEDVRFIIFYNKKKLITIEDVVNDYSELKIDFEAVEYGSMGNDIVVDVVTSTSNYFENVGNLIGGKDCNKHEATSLLVNAINDNKKSDVIANYIINEKADIAQVHLTADVAGSFGNNILLMSNCDSIILPHNTLQNGEDPEIVNIIDSTYTKISSIMSNLVLTKNISSIDIVYAETGNQGNIGTFSDCINIYFNYNHLIGGTDELQLNENIIVDGENEEVISNICDFRHDIFNDKYIELLVGMNALHLQGNFKVKFKYRYQYL